MFRQTFVEDSKSLAAIAGDGHHQPLVHRVAEFVLDRRHEPRGIRVGRVHRDGETEGGRRRRFDLRKTFATICGVKNPVMVLAPYDIRGHGALRQPVRVLCNRFQRQRRWHVCRA